MFGVSMIFLRQHRAARLIEFLIMITISVATITFNIQRCNYKKRSFSFNMLSCYQCFSERVFSACLFSYKIRLVVASNNYIKLCKTSFKVNRDNGN